MQPAILVLNAGSSSIKFLLFADEGGRLEPRFRGQIEGIHTSPRFIARTPQGAVIGENSIVAGHSFVADNTIIPPNSIVMGTPASVVRTANSFIANRVNAMLYYRNALAYARGEHRAWTGSEHTAQMAAWTEEIEREFASQYGV